MKLTINQLATQIKVDYAVAAGFVKYLTNNGLATKVGNLTVEGRKGKPASIYELPDKFEISLGEKI